MTLYYNITSVHQTATADFLTMVVTKEWPMGWPRAG